ncbi:hypothetical protein PoB_006046300 [Plakobranchus ocellatus]|uniref:SMB domain-containing protein n=1 Tax=Plakobranchus ocellatus TaxID=259542 RepID=A0AAV4CPZ9_9GAST|nr:hypothetical protein PoB_006046300 [Plakobranchus ocellatus]
MTIHGSGSLIATQRLQVMEARRTAELAKPCRVTKINKGISRLFDTADLPSASLNTSSNRDQLRAEVVTDRTGFSEGQTSTDTMLFRSQPPCFPGNLRTWFRCLQPSCTSTEEGNDKFNQSQPHLTESSDFIEVTESADDRSKKTPNSLLNSREATYTHFKVSNKTSESFENKSDADIVQSIQLVHHSFWATGRSRSTLNSDQTIGNTAGPTLNTKSETDFNYIETSTSKEKDSLIHSYLNYNQVTASALMGYDNDIDLLLFTFTCQGRCGEKISFPCSGSATCYLYDTCCDNMAQDCPHILNEGRARFNHIRTADITCSKYSIYIIETCPRSANENDGQKDIDTANMMGNVLGKKNTSLGLKKRSSVLLPWSTVKCPIQNEKSLALISDRGNSESDSRTLCSLFCHHSSFMVRSDGICKADHEALLAIADDGLAPLCPAAITGMDQFVACSLKKELESLSTADFSAPSVSSVFDSRLKRNLYVVKLCMALPKRSTYIFSISEKDTIPNIVLVARLAKAFKDYRISRSLCSEKKKSTENSDLTVIRSSTLAVYASRLRLELAQDMEAIRGPTVDDQNSSTTVCVAPLTMIDYIDGLTMDCMDDHLYERDSTWLSEFRSSPCFRHLESPDGNEATTVMDSHGG